LKHRCLEDTQFALWLGQEVENEFAVPGGHLKHRFLELTRVAYCACQDVENEIALDGDNL